MEKVANASTSALKTLSGAVKAMMWRLSTAGRIKVACSGGDSLPGTGRVTSNLSDNVNAHVLSCQAAIDTFKGTARSLTWLAQQRNLTSGRALMYWGTSP